MKNDNNVLEYVTLSAIASLFISVFNYKVGMNIIAIIILFFALFAFILSILLFGELIVTKKSDSEIVFNFLLSIVAIVLIESVALLTNTDLNCKKALLVITLVSFFILAILMIIFYIIKRR